MQANRRWGVLAATALVVAFAVGCRAHLTEYEIPEYTQSAASAQITAEQMMQAVRRGCVAAGWNVLQENPGVTYAQVVSGGHDATVAIPYDGSYFRIEHHDSSEGVGFDGEVVHHRYKFWVDRLYRHIHNEVVAIQGAGPAAAPVAAPAPTAPPPDLAPGPAVDDETDLPPIEPAE